MSDSAAPAAGTPTIGRAAELALVDRWLDAAEDGRPRVGIVRGAPGVGKSHLLRAAGSHAAARGFRVLAATGFTGSPPLVPALTALAPLLAEGDAGRRRDLTDDDVQTLGLLARAGPTSLDGGTTGRRRGDDTHRYVTAVRLVLGAAREEPLLLVVDDAHALDDASATLVAHLLSAALLRAEAQQVRFAALLAVRPGEGSPAARRAVTRMSAEPGTAELELGGLDELELNELLTSFGPHPPSRPLLRLVRSRTAGNPLHSRLLWDHLLASGGALVEGDRMVLGDPSELAAARLDVDDVIDTRLDALEEGDRAILAVAAVLGPEGDLAGLAEVLGSDPDEVEAALLQGKAAGLCHLRGDGYAFDQPLVAAVLCRSISARRRQRLHLRLAAALAARPEPRVLDVAAHLRDAGDQAPAVARRQWCAAAGERAVQLGAWSDAVAAFTAALEDGAADDLDASRLLALHVSAATASGADHDLETCERFASRGIELARATGDVDAWCALARVLGHARVRVTGGARVRPVDDLDELLAALDDRPDLAAGITALLAEAAFAAFDFDVGLAAAREATRLARLSGDDEVLAFVLFAQGLQHQGRFELDASERCFAESIAAGGSPTRAHLWSRDRLPSAHWLRGELSAVESTAAAGEVAAAEALDWAELSLVTAWRAAGAGASGRLGDAIGLAERALALQRRSDYAFTSIVARPVLILARALRGDLDGARRTIEEWETGSSSRWKQRLGVLALALSGNVDEAGAELDRRPWRSLGDGAVDLRTAASLCAQVEVGDLLDRPEMAAAGLPALTSLHRRGVRFVPGSLGLVSRLAGVAAARRRDPTQAARWFATARRDAARAGAAGERARTDLDEVRLLGGGGAGAPAAPDALAGAAAAFDHLGMLPFLRRCEATAAELGLPSVERLGKVVLFTDLVGSTALNAAAGDRRYVRLLRTHDRVVRELLHRHDGVEFKHTGDGLAAWFASARRAVRCAIDLHASVALAVDADFGLDVRLRCGLAAGDPIEDAGDLFGLSVTRAARLCQQAAPGEVLVSAEVLPMVGDAPVVFADRGLVPLRGIPEPTHVFAAARPDV